MKNLSINKNAITLFILLLYFISISAFQLGSGFDAIFVRTIFAILIAIVLMTSKKIIINNQIKWCLLFWGWYFLSILWAKNANDTMYYFNTFIQIIGLSVCMPLIIKDGNSINQVLKLIVFSLFITSMVLIMRTPLSDWGMARLGPAIGLGPNVLGMEMAIGTIITLYIYRSSPDVKKRNLKKIICIFLMILFFMITLFSGSKKAIVMVTIGVVGYEIISTKGLKLFLKLVILLITLYAGVILIMTNENLYKVLGRRVERTILTITGKAQGNDIDNSLRERQFYIQKSLDLFKSNPIIGYGGNNFVTYMRDINYDHVAYSHNNFTEILCTLGIVGFIIYYSIWITTLFKSIKMYMRQKDPKLLFFSIINFIILVMDYGNVSYINVFNILLLILSYLSVNIHALKKVQGD